MFYIFNNIYIPKCAKLDLSLDSKLAFSWDQILLSDLKQYLYCDTTEYLTLFKMKYEMRLRQDFRNLKAKF